MEPGSGCKKHLKIKETSNCDLKTTHYCSRTEVESLFVLCYLGQAPKVQTLDSAIHRINPFPADRSQGNQLRYGLVAAEEEF